MFCYLKVLFIVLCVATILGLILLRVQVFQENLPFEQINDYCFFGTENAVPRNYSEEAIKRDILSKLPKNMRSEVQKGLRKTEIIYRNKLGRAMGETACPFQEEITSKLFYEVFSDIPE